MSAPPRPTERRRPWWQRSLRSAMAASAPPVIGPALRVLSWTLRIQVLNAEELFDRWARGEQVIVAFWHNRLLMMPIAAAGARICIMVSHHRDGEMATRALERWGIHTVRGSASRGAVPGFMRLVGAYRNGYSLAVLPDGPRGPRYVAKPGVIYLARSTGAVIYPVSFAASRATRLRSWDRLIVPLPFARVRVVVGEPLRVSEHADNEQMETQRRALEQRLTQLNRDAEARLAA